MFSIIKIFKIKDTSATTVDVSAFLNSFYEKMIQGGHINSTVSVENFIPILQQIKIPFLDANKLIGQSTYALDGNSVLWQADFDSEESYQEYKNALSNVFSTDFHLIIDSPDISLVIAA
jgi:plasmid replication initiation protein